MARRPGWGTEFLSDGGPLIVLPRELLGSWMGAEGEPSSQDFPFGPDYARACRSNDAASLLEVGAGIGLLLGDETFFYPIQWVDLREERGVALVGWCCCNDQDEERVEVEGLLRGESGWECLERRFHLASGELVLLHAANVGTEVDELDAFGELHAMIADALPVRLKPGTYKLEVMEAGGPFDERSFHCYLCRWLPADC